MSLIIIILAASLIIPSALESTFTPSKPSGLDDNILVLSYVPLIILLMLYITYLYFKLESYTHLYGYANAVEVD
jgi:Ca2+/H+ antiporter